VEKANNEKEGAPQTDHNEISGILGKPFRGNEKKGPKGDTRA